MGTPLALRQDHVLPHLQLREDHHGEDSRFLELSGKSVRDTCELNESVLLGPISTQANAHVLLRPVLLRPSSTQANSI